MSECVLDKLVPSAKINKVTLESIMKTGERGTRQAASDGNYTISCDVSIYDTVPTRGGIADLFFTDDFKKYFSVLHIIAKDSYANSAIERILAMEHLDEPLRMAMLYLCFIDDNEAYGASGRDLVLVTLKDVFQISQSTAADLRELFEQMNNDSYQSKELRFANSTAELGYNTFDDDGNYSYNLKVPIAERVRFENSFDVENCSLYVVPFYDFPSAFEDRGFSVDSLSVEQIYSLGAESFDRVEILNNKRVSDSRVQDFRLIDRATEFVQPQVLSTREALIKRIQQLTDYNGTNDRKYSDLFTPLMHTFKRTTAGIYTNCFFFFDVSKILERSSKLSFLYSRANVDFTSEQISSMRIRKQRVDTYEDPTYIELLNETDYSESSILSYYFTDRDTASTGTYSYTLEMTLVDPMQAIVDNLIDEIINKEYSIVKKLKEALEYLNNSKDYNALTGEITTLGESRLFSMFSDSRISDSTKSFQDLFYLFTGKEFMDIVQAPDTNIISASRSREWLENYLRVYEAFLFEVSKYVEFTPLQATNTGTTASSIIELKYRFPQTIDCEVQERGMFELDGLGIGLVSVDKTRYESRMRDEVGKFSSMSTENAKNLGYMTPDKYNDVNLNDIQNNDDAFFSFVSTSFVGSESTNTDIDKALLDPENGSATQYAIKRDEATFETFAGTLGLTVNPVGRLVSPDDEPARIRTIRGIEYGDNAPMLISNSYLDIGVRDDVRSRSVGTTQARNISALRRRSKKEELVTRFLNSTDGYSMIDRETFTQGERTQRRFNRNNYSQAASQQNLPDFIGMHPRFFSRGESGNLYVSLYHRLFLNNIFEVKYLKPIQSGNVVLEWEVLKDFDNIPSGTLCKLERYRSEALGINDSYLVDREIMFKYFYLV